MLSPRKRRAGQGWHHQGTKKVLPMLLSILMPSNRPLATARRSIETALVFCQARGAELVISDNSGDEAKRRWLEGLSPVLRYTQPAEAGLHANLRHLYDQAQTEFILMMGDDDEIFVVPDKPAVDLAALGPDHVGVRPLTAVTNSAGKVIRVKDFGIADEMPGARVMRYNEHAKGDNAAYYSIFRREPFVALHRFFLDHHPVKGGYCDWSLAAAMFSFGKMAYDPSILFKYNHHRWDNPDKIDERMQDMYREAGLDADSDRFALLLLYLDLMIMALRREGPLGEGGKRDLMANAGAPILMGFCRRVAASPELYDERICYLASEALAEPNLGTRFSLALLMAESVQSGFKDRYQTFYRTAMVA